MALTVNLEMVARKTGSLTWGIFRAAASLATDDGAVIDRFAELGSNLGVAMQIANDVAAVSTERDRNDLARGKQGLTIPFAPGAATGEQRAWLEELVQRAAHGEFAANLEQLRAILQETGAFHYALLIADVYWERVLAGLGPGPLRQLVETMRNWQTGPPAGESDAG